MKKSHLLYFIWIPLAVLLSFAVYFVLKWGLKPKPIAQINPTRFEEPEQIGAVVYRRLRAVLRQEKLLVIGSASWINDSDKIWNGFIAAAREDGVQIARLYQEESVRPVKEFKGLPVAPLDGAKFDRDRDGSKLVVLHTTSLRSSHSDKNSLTRQLEQELKRPWPSITLLSLAVTGEEIEALEPPCPIAQIQSEPHSLGCSSARISRKFLRRRYDPTALWAAMERHGLKDYLLFVHNPQ